MQVSTADKVNTDKLAAYQVETQVVLARQTKQEEACFGVTITPVNDEQRKAAAASPKKVVVLWPVLGTDGSMVITWGICPQGEIKDATDKVVAEYFQKHDLKDKKLAEKNLTWCRDYVANDKVPEQRACQRDQASLRMVERCECLGADGFSSFLRHLS